MSESESKSLKQTMESMNAYAKKGDIKKLYTEIRNDPFILQKIDEIPFSHAPLHEAAAHGETSFAIEIMGLLPSLGRKLNLDGLSPLHIALEKKQKKTALALVNFDRQLVRVKGFEGNTPLHFAAKHFPDVDVLAGFLLACQLSIDDRNNRFQSAVHLVMEGGDHKAIDMVLKWLVRTAREHVLGWKDLDSESALHVAARHNRIEAVQFMRKIAKLNQRNSKEQTPLDVAQQFGHTILAQILMKAGAKKAEDLSAKQTGSDYLGSKINFLEKPIRRYCFLLKDLSVQMRGVVLVVAVLIATATYQAVLQPPSGVYPAGDEDSGNSPSLSLRIGGRRALASPGPAAAAAPGFQPSKAGTVVMNHAMYIQFMPANTLAFTLAIMIIIFVLHGRPYNAILHTCLIFLSYSYLVAMESISEVHDGGVSSLMFTLSWGVLSAAYAVKMVYYLVKALFEDVWWLPRCGVRWHNWSYQKRGPLCQCCMVVARKLRRQCKLIQKLE